MTDREKAEAGSAMNERRMRLAAEGQAKERANREGAPMRIFHDTRDGIWFVRSIAEGPPAGHEDWARGINLIDVVHPEVSRA